MSTILAMLGTLLMVVQAARSPFSWLTLAGLVLLGAGWILRAVSDWRRGK